MSRGLGTWQRRILDALPESHTADVISRGMAFYIGTDDAWHRACGLDIMLPRHVYDLDVVRGILMRGIEISDWQRHTMQEAVSRAVRTLICRRELERLELVPVTRYRTASGYGEVPAHLIHRLADGDFLDYGKRRARFVTRPPELA